MSHPLQVRVLAHNQSVLSKRSVTLVPFDVADLLVQRMCAERISRKLIRMLPSDSVFPLKLVSPQVHYIPEKLPPVNGDDNIFREPQDELWVMAHQAAIRSVRVRAWATQRALFGCPKRIRGRELIARSVENRFATA